MCLMFRWIGVGYTRYVVLPCLFIPSCICKLGVYYLFLIGVAFVIALVLVYAASATGIGEVCMYSFCHLLIYLLINASAKQFIYTGYPYPLTQLH